MAKIRVALDSSFELAFRRALFLLILLVIYLVAGSFVFIALCRGESHRTKVFELNHYNNVINPNWCLFYKKKLQITWKIYSLRDLKKFFF